MAEVKMPQLGETVVEGTITKWLKQEGDTVEEDELLVEISTDKVDSEVPSSAAGVLKKILVPEGETVSVGTPLAVIEGEGESSGDGGGSAAQADEGGEPERPQEQGGGPETAPQAGSTEQAPEKTAEQPAAAAPAQQPAEDKEPSAGQVAPAETAPAAAAASAPSAAQCSGPHVTAAHP
ncbi:MAG: biotin/lipoyl-containing protein [Actinomycetota bacterium]